MRIGIVGLRHESNTLLCTPTDLPLWERSRRNEVRERWEGTHNQVLVAKGVHAPVPAYEPVCPTIIRVNTQGSTSADMLGLPFRNRRRPLFPFEEVF